MILKKSECFIFFFHVFSAFFIVHTTVKSEPDLRAKDDDGKKTRYPNRWKERGRKHNVRRGSKGGNDVGQQQQKKKKKLS